MDANTRNQKHSDDNAALIGQILDHVKPRPIVRQVIEEAYAAGYEAKDGTGMKMDKETGEIADPENRFTGLPLRFELVDWKHRKLLRSTSYRTKANEISTVKRGFVFDLASVPRLLWWLYPPAGTKGNPYGVASLWHDWLCSYRKIEGRPITFSEANGIFKEVMLYLGCRKTLAWTMYLAVQSPFGWWLWKKRKPEDIIP